jgi:hypothetical protein
MPRTALAQLSISARFGLLASASQHGGYAAFQHVSKVLCALDKLAGVGI